MGLRWARQKLAGVNLCEWNTPMRAIRPVVAGGKVTSLAAVHTEVARDKSVARVGLRERSESTLSGPYPVIERTWTARSSFDRLSPNLSKIITIYASTSLREIQGLEACGHLGGRDENPREPRPDMRCKGGRSL